jgi:hypothetical protein
MPYFFRRKIKISIEIIFAAINFKKNQGWLNFGIKCKVKFFYFDEMMTDNTVGWVELKK